MAFDLHRNMQGGFLGAEDFEEDWLAPLSNGLQATQLNAGPPADVRRVNSSPAMAYPPVNGAAHTSDGWGSTAPLPIRPMRRMVPDDYSSLESSQSLLAAAHGSSSFTDDNHYLQRHPLGGSALRHGAYPHSMPAPGYAYDPSPLLPQDALAAIEMPLAGSAAPVPACQLPPHAAATIPGQGGHWAWIPSPGPAPAHAHHQQAQEVQTVPVSAGPLPLPVAMGALDMDFDLLDSIDILEMADTLAPEHHHVQRPGPRGIKRAVGSCPLPALLEDSLSAEDVSFKAFIFRKSWCRRTGKYWQPPPHLFLVSPPPLLTPLSPLLPSPHTGWLRRYHAARPHGIPLPRRPGARPLRHPLWLPRLRRPRPPLPHCHPGTHSTPQGPPPLPLHVLPTPGLLPAGILLPHPRRPAHAHRGPALPPHHRRCAARRRGRL